MKSTPSSFRIDADEAHTLYFFYIKDAREAIRRAVRCRKHINDDDGSFWAGRQAAYLLQARQSAAFARRWCKKFDWHFGTKSLAQRAEEDRQRQQRIADYEAKYGALNLQPSTMQEAA